MAHIWFSFRHVLGSIRAIAFGIFPGFYPKDERPQGSLIKTVAEMAHDL
jgi:hypothetical protein